MGIFRALADNKNDTSLANRFRRKRFELFRSLVEPLPRPLTILDVGGTENFWKRMGCTAADGLQITLINLCSEPVSLPFIQSLAGDARDLARFPDGAFDIVFSNSVIEHVGDPADQEAMAKEIRRVGKRYFVQTPARSFPIEPHFLFPFFAVLPDPVRLFLIRHFNLGWYRKIPDREQAKSFLKGFQLLNSPQFASLFPGGTLFKERTCGLTKSYIIHAGFK